jgi:carbon monoxide dehydrogenase subunit G
MAISHGGEFRVGKSPEEVFAFLTDPNRFAPLLPDYQSHAVTDERNFIVTVKVGVGHIRGAARVGMQLTEAERPSRAAYQGKGSVAGGSVNVTAGFDLAPDGSGTRVNWKGEAQLHGPLISIAGGMIEPLARKNIQRLIEAVQKALG